MEKTILLFLSGGIFSVAVLSLSANLISKLCSHWGDVQSVWADFILSLLINVIVMLLVFRSTPLLLGTAAGMIYSKAKTVFLCLRNTNITK